MGVFTPGPLFRNLERFPLRSVRLGICEHGNCPRICTKTNGPRSPERGGLGSIENELWSGSVVVRKQFDPTNQAVSHFIMGTEPILPICRLRKLRRAPGTPGGPLALKDVFILV